ncbi:hypothetical protein XENOCAPTIV_026198 [Xenoophorus captivus]|uniref:Uncharacterized protein n=1 Tax=Xenoophorus captivus TaxID=1517983 RepID=A0ABV0RNR5_9TELE
MCLYLLSLMFSCLLSTCASCRCFLRSPDSTLSAQSVPAVYPGQLPLLPPGGLADSGSSIALQPLKQSPSSDNLCSAYTSEAALSVPSLCAPTPGKHVTESCRLQQTSVYHLHQQLFARRQKQVLQNKKVIHLSWFVFECKQCYGLLTLNILSLYSSTFSSLFCLFFHHLCSCPLSASSIIPLFRLCKVQLGFGACGLQAGRQEDALSEYALLGSLCVTLYFFALLLTYLSFIYIYIYNFFFSLYLSSHSHHFFLLVFEHLQLMLQASSDIYLVRDNFLYRTNTFVGRTF